MYCDINGYLLFTAAPKVQSLQQTEQCGSAFCLSCISTGSVASFVDWMKNGELLNTNGRNNIYSTVQLLKDSTTSTYENMLLVDSIVDIILGEYLCVVSNTIGEDEGSLELNGQ